MFIDCMLRAKNALITNIHVSLIILIAALTLVFGTKNSTIPMVFTFIGVFHLAKIAIRVRLFVEEYFYLKFRYENDLLVLLKDAFYFKPLEILTFFLYLISLFTFSYFHTENVWSVSIWPHFGFFSLIFCYLNYSFYIPLDECPVSTSIQLQNFHGLDYGSGMAYSFFYGYLNIMLPKDNGAYRSFLEFVEIYQSHHKVQFAVKKLFILLPTSCECFSSLQTSFYENIEEAKPLDTLELDVAGVKKRLYRNAVYKIKKPNSEKVYVSVEYATPLRTFKESISHFGRHSWTFEKYKNDVVLRFYLTLSGILKENPNCGALCELIYYNDKNADGTYRNIGNIILRRIMEIKAGISKR